MKARISLIVLLTCLLFSACQPQGLVEDSLQDVLDRGVDKYEINGVSATVIFPDGEVWNGVSGISHDDVPIDPEMLFAIGSVSKNLVATLTLSLVEEAVLSLDDPISSWLPEYPYVDGDVTIRQLLNHTSGVYNYFENQQIWDDLIADRSRFFTPDEVLGYLKEPDFEPGEGWRYSNTNYLLLSMIIKQATGSNLSTELHARFWDPLGIPEFYVPQEEPLPLHLAHVYGDNWDGAVRDVTFLPRTSHDSITSGAGGFYTTAESLARWSHSLFGGELLAPQTMDEMLEFVEFSPVSNMRAYGLGVQEFRKNISLGELAIGHGGAYIGTTTYMVYLPEHEVSIVVMINAFPNEAAEPILQDLEKVALQELGEYGLWQMILGGMPFSMIAIAAVPFWAVWITKWVREKRGASSEEDLNASKV